MSAPGPQWSAPTATNSEIREDSQLLPGIVVAHSARHAYSRRPFDPAADSPRILRAHVSGCLPVDARRRGSRPAAAAARRPVRRPALPSVSGTLVNRTLTITRRRARRRWRRRRRRGHGDGVHRHLSGRAHGAEHGDHGDRRLHARGLRRHAALPTRVYVCPCHGSEFNTSGAVVQGPATSSLRQFPTTFANNVVTISV